MATIRKTKGRAWLMKTSRKKRKSTLNFVHPQGTKGRLYPRWWIWEVFLVVEATKRLSMGRPNLGSSSPALSSLLLLPNSHPYRFLT